METLPSSNPSRQATHQPRWTKAALSHSLLALLYMPRDALLLCVHILFKGLSFLSPSLSVSFSISRPPPFPLLICFSPPGFGISFIEEHIVRLLSISEDGPREAEWVTVGALGSPFAVSARRPTPCHKMMSWLLFALGVPIDSLCLLHTLSISLFHPPLLPPNLHSCSSQPVPFPDPFASQKAPGGFGDVWMLFSTPTVHA